MSEDNKNDDWGMTMPNVRLDEEKKEKEAAGNFAPKVDSAPSQPPADDWGMTQANVKIPQNPTPPQNQASSQPFSDFDKTTPNINAGQQFSDTPKQAPPSAPQDDWGMTQANVNLPKEEKKEDWNMPSPVFRISSGETPNFDKTTPNINLKNSADDFDSDFDENIGNQTTPYYRLPENQAASSVAVESKPSVSDSSDREEVKKKPAEKAASGNMKWILILGGLFAFFLVATTGLFAVYFLFLNDSGGTVKSEPTANKSSNTTTTPAPTVSTPTASLPPSVNYKGEMVLVPAGEFTMGSDTGGDESKPAHKVTLPAYYIDKYEVTNAQYKEFCTATNRTPPPDPFWEKGYFENRPSAPVLGVSFDDAKAFAEWAGKRLPSEQEWEKAASWNDATQSKFEFPWGNKFENGKASFGLKTTSDVNKFLGASPSGAMDMAGNVAEWVDDFFKPYPGNTTSNPNFGETNRVVRGGHFGSKTNEFLKTTKRIYVPPTVASGEDEEKLFAAAIGFRCVVSADNSGLQDVLRK